MGGWHRSRFHLLIFARATIRRLKRGGGGEGGRRIDRGREIEKEGGREGVD